MNKQEELWKSDFGMEYALRNPSNLNAMDKLYMDNFGITRTQLNEELLKGIDRNISILEVGCNTGSQLHILEKMGFIDLSGIELVIESLLEAKRNYPRYNLIQANALDIPYKDKCFDLVFTSGVLIHIAEDNLDKAMEEMYRVSNKYIWCYEYYSDERKMINYRGIDNVLWKENFCKRFMDKYPDLELVASKKINYLNTDNVDEMFLLKKRE